MMIIIIIDGWMDGLVEGCIDKLMMMPHVHVCV